MVMGPILVHHGSISFTSVHLLHSIRPVKPLEGIPDATPALPVTGCGLSNSVGNMKWRPHARKHMLN